MRLNLLYIITDACCVPHAYSIVLGIGMMAVEDQYIFTTKIQRNSEKANVVVTFGGCKLNRLQEDMQKVPKAGIPTYGSDGENTPPPVY
jgi:hypothetical protein